MRPEGIAAAQRELKRAARAQRRLVTADSLEDADEAWGEFLTHANRVYTKLRAACHGQGVDWMWFKKKMDERRDDPLLSYIHHARNCDTHRLEPMTEHIEAGRGQSDVPGIGKISWGGVAHLRPLPVVDKAVTYDPPTHHFTIGIGYADCGRLSWLASMYLHEMVAEAASRRR